MRFEPKAPVINDSEPWAASAFELADTGERLTNLVKAAEGPAVISLTSPWGTGKTTFLNMWSASLRKQDAKVVKFSAWEVDYTHDALVALIQELGTQLKTEESDHQALEQIKSRGIELLRHVAPFAVKVATNGLIDLEGAGDFSKALIEKKLAAHENAKLSAERFRACLKEYAERLQQEGNRFPLVIIVDELDRCRPNYAVELLESIKHFFNVSGVVFVVGIDAEQLGEAIKGHYGQGYDGHRYLRRFFHLQLQLPEPDLESFCSNILEQLELSNSFDDPSIIRPSKNAFSTDFLADLAQTYQLSLRDIERLTLEAGAIYTANSKFPPFLANPILWLLIQKHLDPKLFRDIAKGKMNSEALWQQIEPYKDTLFRGSEPIEIRFRVVMTYLLEQKKGIGSLSMKAKNHTEANNPRHQQAEYWSQVFSETLKYLDSNSQEDFLSIALSTMSLLGYRTN